MKLSKLITLAALVAIGPAFAADKHDHAHGHESLHGGLVVEVKDVDLELVAKPDVIQFAPGLPKTRSGKIMRRILRKIAEGDTSSLGDTSTLADPSVVDDLVKNAAKK